MTDEKTQAIKELLNKEVPGLRWDAHADRAAAVFFIQATVKVNDKEMVVEAGLPFEEYAKGDGWLKALSQDVAQKMTEGFTRRIAGK